MILKVSTQYKKDLKRYQNKPSKIAALKEVLNHPIARFCVDTAE